MWVLFKAKPASSQFSGQVLNSSNQKRTKTTSTIRYISTLRKRLQLELQYFIDVCIRLNSILLYIVCLFLPIQTFKFFARVWYFIYVTIPFKIYFYIWELILLFLEKFCRRNYVARKLVIHGTEIVKLGAVVWSRAKDATLRDLLLFLYTMCSDFIVSWYYPRVHTSPHSRSISELSELLVYEELQSQSNKGHDNGNGNSSSQANDLSKLSRKRTFMHHNVPFNPFKATIKVHTPAARFNKDSSSSRPNSSVSSASYSTTRGLFHLFSPTSYQSNESLNLDLQDMSETFLEQYKMLHDVSTPQSFPPTPFSRAHVMNRSAERVTSVMFSARDKLRQDLLSSSSSDEFSRQFAKEAKRHGYLAVFDPKKSSESIALSCGNHSAIKVGETTCATTQSMLPILAGIYVYFEFSLTVSENQNPSVSMGLSPPDSPLHISVGTWERSLGINSEGLLFVGNKVFKPKKPFKIVPGNTVGFLQYVPDRHEYYPLNDADKDSTANSCYETIAEHFYLAINVDGKLCEYDERAFQSNTLEEIIEFQTPLYPSISILTPNTRVWSRFCEADIVTRNRANIGAPLGVAVYCVDGSILLQPSN